MTDNRFPATPGIGAALARNEQIETAVLQRQAARLVEREVMACMSSMVSTLAGGYGLSHFQNGGRPNSPGASKAYVALDALAEQAMELASPVPDYEGAAREAGWRPSHDDADIFSPCHATTFFGADRWRAACERFAIEPNECEVYEHWAVSSWLAEKLIAKGERVDPDFAGLNVWARTTTGQAISIDSVIEAIVRETGYASHPATDAA